MTLKTLRKKIDSIDSKIVGLMNERANVSIKIGANKIQTKKAIYSPDREKEVLSRIKALNKGPMTPEAFEAIYREVMSSSLSLEKKLRIAYLGTEGSFTHMAANKKFGSQVCYVSCHTINDVFERVEHDDCDYGVVPVENSLEGAVTHTFDLLVDSDLKICAQTMMKINQTLMAKCSLNEIKAVYSNIMVFGQCRQWLAANLPKAGQILVPSTTEAAKKAVNEKYVAAIASPMAAKIYQLPILRLNIQDVAHNSTRFLVIGSQNVPSTGKDRTSIVFSIKDRVGALHAMLTPFMKNKLNLSKIESRPSKKKAWDYYFFVDIEGHRDDKPVKRALDQLEGMCKYLKILGSYPILE